MGIDNPDLKILQVLAGNPVWPPPIWLMRQAGRYLPEYRALRKEAPDFLSFCYTPDLAVEATLQPIRRFGFDASIVFSDILVIADALGATVGFEEGRGPVLKPVRDAAAVQGLTMDGVAETCAPVYEILGRLRKELPKDVTLIGFVGGPWTVATYMVEGSSSKDFAAIKNWMWTDPSGFWSLIELLTGATIQHAKAQIEAGADCIQLFESWAGILPEAEFNRYVIEPTAAIVEALRIAYPNVPVIGFPRAAGVLSDEYLERTGIQAIGADAMVPLSQQKRWQKNSVVQGNLDPHHLIAGGPTLQRRVIEIAESLKEGPHIFNLGHGILPQTPPDHVVELIETVRGLA